MPENRLKLQGKRWRVLIGLIFLTLVMVSCNAKPLPLDKKSYAGEWKGIGMTLIITDDGSIHYKRIRGAGHTEINGPIQEFKGNDFSVGLGPISTTFKVEKPPYQTDGKWKMVVDGLELTRAD